ncbi:hypothetical protein ACHAXR_009248 [Thalassiosira sp. AJA248-18]
MPYIHNSLSQDTIAVADSLFVMLQKEKTIFRSCNYFDLSSSPAVTRGSDRMKVVDWCYSIIDNTQFDRETVAIAMNMVDRFLSKLNKSTVKQQTMIDHQHFQLLSIAALYISIKINESVALGSDEVARATLGGHSAKDIEAMELTILQVLDWQIWAPTSIQMAHHILSFLLPHVNLEKSTWDFILGEVRFQTEHAVRDHYFSTQLQSTVAVAAIFNALDRVDLQFCQDILCEVLLEMDEESFASNGILLDARNRLNLCLD